MLYACAARFDVTGNLKNFWKLNKATAPSNPNYKTFGLSIFFSYFFSFSHFFLLFFFLISYLFNLINMSSPREIRIGR